MKKGQNLQDFFFKPAVWQKTKEKKNSIDKITQ